MERSTHREFLGLSFTPCDMQEMLATLRSRDPAAAFAYVVTPNVDHVVRLEREPARRHAYDLARWCLCDSRILAALARRHGVDLPVVPGSDLTPAVLTGIVAAGDRVAIIGGADDLPERLGALLPGVDIVQHRPPMGLARNPRAIAEAADFVADARARFTFLAVGSPQQELVAAAVVERGGASGVGLCIGASIDFMLGDQVRAPRWMQRLHVEWLHRLLSSPRRMARRYLVEGPRIFRIARRWARLR